MNDYGLQTLFIRSISSSQMADLEVVVDSEYFECSSSIVTLYIELAYRLRIGADPTLLRPYSLSR